MILIGQGDGWKLRSKSLLSSTMGRLHLCFVPPLLIWAAVRENGAILNYLSPPFESRWKEKGKEAANFRFPPRINRRPLGKKKTLEIIKLLGVSRS